MIISTVDNITWVPHPLPHLNGKFCVFKSVYTGSFCRLYINECSGSIHLDVILGSYNVDLLLEEGLYSDDSPGPTFYYTNLEDALAGVVKVVCSP